ncbi:hypothetical protein V6N13_146346 [Hibiscus sabdariffa]
MVGKLRREVRDRICCIPLARPELQDKIVWRYDQTGEYSVKSGYKVLRNEFSDAPSSIVVQFYKQMWNVNLPPKVKITMWRIANNYISTFANLQVKRLNVNNICPLCQSSSETVSHLMKECSFASKLQYALNVPTSCNSAMNGWFDWLVIFFCSLDENRKKCLMVIYWVVWFTRNKVVYENIVPLVSESIAFVRTFLQECGSISNNESANPVLQSVSWQAPLENVYKFNFDTSFNSQNRSSTSGVIGRDITGEIMTSCVVPHNNVLDALMAEALACLQSVHYAKELGFRRVIIEGDSLIVIKKLNEGMHDRSTIAPVIHDIRMKARDFDVISFVFVKQDANNTVHVLARDHRTQHDPCFWIEEAPENAAYAANMDRLKLDSV